DFIKDEIGLIHTKDHEEQFKQLTKALLRVIDFRLKMIKDNKKKTFAQFFINPKDRRLADKLLIELGITDENLVSVLTKRKRSAIIGFADALIDKKLIIDTPKISFYKALMIHIRTDVTELKPVSNTYHKFHKKTKEAIVR